MKTNLKIFIFLSFNLLLCRQGLCEVRIISLKNSDTVSIDIPSSWVSQTIYDQKNIATIEFSPSDNKDIRFTITLSNTNNFLTTNLKLRERVSSIVGTVSSSAVEKDIAIQEFKKEERTCYYFTATDKNPKPNEYSIITQGILQGKNFLMPFTALYNDKKSFPEETLINLLSTIELRLSKASTQPSEQKEKDRTKLQ